MDPKHSDDLHYLWWLALATVAGVLVYLLSPILTPFMLAGIIAYICNPLMTRLAAGKISRTFGALLVMVLLLGMFVALLLIVLPLFEKEVSRLIERAPAYLETIKSNLIPWLEAQLGISLQLDIPTLKQALAQHWQSAGGAAAKLLPSLTSGGMALVEFFMSLLLVPVVLFYLLRDWDGLVRRIDEMIPRRWHEQTHTLARETDRVLAEFLRGQLAVMLLMSVCYVAGLWLVGLEFALPIGLLAGLLVFVPYLGAAVGLILATLAALMQFQGWSGLLPVWVVFAVGQLLEGMVVTPWLVGDRIGLHPVMVIFALLAFGQLFGFFGLLLALPVSAALLVWLRHARTHYLQSDLYK
ncbi:MAG: AI-2E family transporter [Pseudomonadota bacterium]